MAKKNTLHEWVADMKQAFPKKRPKVVPSADKHPGKFYVGYPATKSTDAEYVAGLMTKDVATFFLDALLPLFADTEPTSAEDLTAAAREGAGVEDDVPTDTPE